MSLVQINLNDEPESLSSQGKLLIKKKSDKHNSTYVPRNRMSRYTTALTNLIPVRLKKVPGSELPLDKIGLFSSVSFSWLNEYIHAGCKNGMRDKPLGIIAGKESCQINGPRIDSLWHTHVVERGQAGASVPRLTWKFVQTRVLISSLIHFIGMLLQLCSPIIILQKIVSVSTENRMGFNVTSKYDNKSVNNSSTGSLLNATVDYSTQNVIIFSNISLLIAVELVSYFLISWSAALNLRTATRLRSACLALAYKKLIRSSIRLKAPIHQTLTYFVPDSKTFYSLLSNGPLIFSGPIVLFLSTLFIWHSMGHWSLIGILVLIILYLILILNAYLTNIFAAKTMNFSLERLNLMEEYIEKINLAKIIQFDKLFIKKIQVIRTDELHQMKLGALSEGWSLCLVHIIPIITISVTTLAYLFTNQHIISTQYIPCLVLILVNLKHCIRSSWLALSSISRGLASLKKLKSVLILKDTNHYTDKPIDKNLAITINNGHFSWDQCTSTDQIHQSSLKLDGSCSDEQTSNSSVDLSDINFYVQKGKLIGICGAAGSGKTSLLLALMSQLKHIKGHVAIDGSFSYVSEDFALFDGTLKENILLEDTFESTFYYRTIQVCNLNADISTLPGSDDTDLAFIELTSVQKQKIALARAVYAKKDINLLDNPLRDLDPQESLDIFEKMIQVLDGKTVIIVSDKIQFLNKCDTIYMMKDGKVSDSGSHNELYEKNKDYFYLIKSFDKQLQGQSKNILLETIKRKDSMIHHSVHHLDFNLEDRDSEAPTKRSIYGITPQVDYKKYQNEDRKCWSYLVYIFSVFYSAPIAVVPFIFYFIIQKSLTDSIFITITLTSIVGFIIVFGVTLLATYNKDVFHIAKSIHNRWLDKIYRAQISVFSTVSSIILINIYSLDLQEVDYILPKLKITILFQIGISLFSIITLGVLSSWLLIPSIIFVIIAVSYNIYIKKLLIILNESRIGCITPIYNYAVNTINQRVIIQAYKKDKEFIKKFYKHCNESLTYDFLLEALKLWIEYRIKVASGIMLLVTMLICATSNRINSYEILGIAFICSLQLTLSVIHLAGAVIDADSSLINFGFADSYLKKICLHSETRNAVRKEWPLIPSIHFQNVLLTDRSADFEPLNFSIYAGEKVVIDGNVEMKGDLAKALLYYEEVFSGKILIGNLNISDIHIDMLREYIHFIPRIPVLFQGSIRYNLEPNNRKTDKELMTALQKVALWEKVSKLEHQLDSHVDNIFTLMEKKLLFFARIFLKSRNFNRNIIIMEDIDSDADLINALLEEIFKEFTIIVLSNKSNWQAQRIIQL